MSGAEVPNRLVVMAAYDPDGELAAHVRFQLEAWQGQCRRLIFVTTNQLTPSARDWLDGRAELIERDNVGYDFYSYRTGLLAAGDLTAFDQVVICNDTYVGPLRGFAEIFHAMEEAGYDFWGITTSRELKTHVQSFFVVFSASVVAADAFVAFWQDLTPLSDRRAVVRRYEVGLSRKLKAAGFRFGAYFRSHPGEWRRARARVVWWALHRTDVPPGLVARWKKRRDYAGAAPNPMITMADAALDGARLPVVKIEALRHDPYGLGAARLLAEAELLYPQAFAGVAGYLARTAPHYQRRPSMVSGTPTLLLRPVGRLLRYR